MAGFWFVGGVAESFVDVAADVVLLVLHEFEEFFGCGELFGYRLCVVGDVGAEDSGLGVVGVAGGCGVGQCVAGHGAESTWDVGVGCVAH